MQEIRDQLKTIIQELYGLDFDPEISPSPENIDADYSTNAPLKLAKELHKNPMAIAEELASSTNAHVSAPGFLNLTLSDDYLQNEISKLNTSFKYSPKHKDKMLQNVYLHKLHYLYLVFQEHSIQISQFSCSVVSNSL